MPDTHKAYIAPAPRQYPELRFEFRPTSYEERLQWAEDQRNRPPKQQAAQSSALVAKHLTTWSIQHPINAAALMNPAIVDPSLFCRVLDVLLGVAVPDEDPSGETE